MRILLLTALLLTVTNAQAQERTASGAMGAQMTWSALSTKVDAANTRIDQVVTCGKKQMFYAPGANGADAQGCLALANVTKIIDCSQQGAFYSATTNTCTKGTQNRWYKVGTAPNTGWGGRGFVTLAPPAGYGVCTGNEGVVARLCDQNSKPCVRTNSSTSTTWQPQSCGSSDRSCEGNQNVTTTTTWYDLFSCE